MIVDGLRDEHARLEKSGLNPGDVEPAPSVNLVRLCNLDGNFVVLVQPGKVLNITSKKF